MELFANSFQQPPFLSFSNSSNVKHNKICRISSMHGVITILIRDKISVKEMLK